VKRPALIFAAMLVVALLLLLPLRLALAAAGLADSGLAARSVSGSLWAGQMNGTVWRGLWLGDGRASLSPLVLLRGGVSLDWRGEKLSATVIRQAKGGGIDAAKGQFGPVTVSGLVLQRVDLDGFAVVFDSGSCTRAGGRVTLLPGGALAMAGAMAGTPRCDGKAVVIPLASGDSAVQMTIKLRDDASYTASITVEPVAETARPALLAAGFQPSPQGMAMTVEGVL
jgi:general secretion pathway protein N